MRVETIERGTGPVSPLRSSPVEMGDPDVDTVLDGPRPLREVLKETRTDALLVVHGGDLAVEWYRDEASGREPHPTHSVTKSLLGCVAGTLIDAGRLDPAALAATYVPELADGGYALAMVRDLLDMRTGGDYEEDHDDPDGELATMGEIVGWREPTGRPLPGSVWEYAATCPRIALSGGPFAYRSLDSEVLGWVVERVTGRPLAELFGSVILGPIGAEAGGTLLADPVGNGLGSGGMSLLPRDLARFGRMLLNGGAVGRRQVVPALFVKDTRRGQEDSVAAFQDRVDQRLGVEAPDVDGAFYRNQFWIPDGSRRRMLALGVHGQMVLVDSERDVVVVKLSSWDEPTDPAAFTDSMAAVYAAAEAVGGPVADY